ncbi:hypothetical protein CsSME_00046579 [Camellia sinensis var. sinensis]
MHGRLLTNHMRLTRNLADSDICHRCQTEREDMIHVLRGCPKAKNICLKLKDLNWWQREDRKPLPEWLKSNMKSKGMLADIPWSTIFLSAIWNIWKERNKEVFANQTQPIHISTSKILQRAQEIQEANQNRLHPNYCEPRLTKWLSPIAGKLKLNTDGCSKRDPNQSGYGGLLSDKVGTWLWGYRGYLGNCTSLKAELWGLYRGLTIIMQKGMANIEIEIDSQLAMKLTKDGVESTSPYRALIEDVNFMPRRCNCSIQHIPREANQCADALANIGANQTEHLVFQEDPPKLCLFFPNCRHGFC